MVNDTQMALADELLRKRAYPSVSEYARHELLATLLQTFEPRQQRSSGRRLSHIQLVGRTRLMIRTQPSRSGLTLARVRPC